jgi:hypothetical protein
VTEDASKNDTGEHATLVELHADPNLEITSQRLLLHKSQQL